VNFNVNFNVLLSKYVEYPLMKIKKDFDTLIAVLFKLYKELLFLTIIT